MQINMYCPRFQPLPEIGQKKEAIMEPKLILPTSPILCDNSGQDITEVVCQLLHLLKFVQD